MSTFRSSATARMCWKTWCGCGAPARSMPTRRRMADWWKQIDKWRARKSLAYRQSNDVIKPQYAIQRLYELTKDSDTYITTEVGQHQMWAAQFYGFQEPNRWMTSGGLGTMGYGLPASVGVQLRASEIAGHRHRRRGVGADDDAGIVDGGAVPAADQDLHPQQRIHGHGAPVAGIAAWRALFGKLFGSAAGFRQAGRGDACLSASAAKSRAISTMPSRK